MFILSHTDKLHGPPKYLYGLFVFYKTILTIVT